MSDEVQKLQAEAAAAYAKHQEGLASGYNQAVIQSQRISSQVKAQHTSSPFGAPVEPSGTE